MCLLLKRGTIAHLHSVDEMGKVGNHGDVVTVYTFILWVCIFVRMHWILQWSRGMLTLSLY